MKKFIIRFGAVILILSVLLGGAGIFISRYASENIDFKTDELLFENSRTENALTYYAYGQSGELVEAWRDEGTYVNDWCPLAETSEYLIKGFVSVEDRKFYEHKGINLGRTILAFINHLVKYRDKFGASTITQQVVKNISGDDESTVKRKFNEILRALELEKKYSKNEILEVYLNIVPMGGVKYGVSEGAKKYFGKAAGELSIAEAATLIGIANAPTRYDPLSRPIECRGKRDLVLKTMMETGVISESQYTEAVNEELSVIENDGDRKNSSWFVETARADIENDIKGRYKLTAPATDLLLRGGRVILTMNPEIQRILEDFFEDTSNLSPKLSEGLNYSMVVSDPSSGDLLAIIGDGGIKKGEKLLNNALSNIIPGSVIKPLSVYAPLIDKGLIKWSDIYDDAPLEYSGDEGRAYPKNSPDIYEGMMDIETALKKSKNTIAMRLFNMLDPEQTFTLLNDDMHLIGMTRRYTSPDGRNYSDLSASPLALGQLTHGVSLRSLTEAYDLFPNGGVLPSSRSYYAVMDKDGNTLIKKDKEERRIFKEETAAIMNQLLSGVVRDGTARRINLKESIDTAGKTGTSGGDKDRLFIGYTPYVTAGIWCGYSDRSGSVGVLEPSHLEIWDKVMTRVHNEVLFKGSEENVPSFDTSGLILLPYCKKSGKLLCEACELAEDGSLSYGYFDPLNIPTDICDLHEIDKFLDE